MTTKGFKTWSIEDKARVAGLLREGLSAGRICKHFGVTRNAICGLVARDKTLKAIGLRGDHAGGKKRQLTDEQRKENARRSAREYYHVSNNVSMMVEDWLKQNGARKFERGFSSDPFAIKTYLAERGVNVDNYQGKWRMATNGGRMRFVGISEIYELADRFRSAEGRPTILRRAS